MKNLLIAVIIVVVVLSIISGSCSKKSDETNTSSDTVEPQAKQAGSQTASEEVIQPNPPKEEVEKATEVLQNIDKAEVDENTEELQNVMGHLNDICKKAVATRDAMLTAQYQVDSKVPQDEEGGDNRADR